MRQVDAIRVEGLGCSYSGADVLADVSFGIAKGDYVGLVGPNGSGKSTLIKAVLGIIRKTSGHISIFGVDLAGFGDWRRLGYLPQQIASFNKYFPATVREIVSLGLVAGGAPGRGNAEAVDDALRLMDIIEIRDTLIGELSGGQQQRALLARAMVNRPEILFLDEPTAALDPETRERFYATLLKLNRDKGVTVVLVTHDFGTIGKYASKLIYVDKKIIFDGGFNEFCESAEMQRYFGEFSQHIICHRHDDGAVK